MFPVSACTSEGWFVYDASCYMLSNDSADRNHAQNSCSQLDANLVSIGGQEENDLALNLSRYSLSFKPNDACYFV